MKNKLFIALLVLFNFIVWTLTKDYYDKQYTRGWNDCANHLIPEVTNIYMEYMRWNIPK